MWRNRDVVRFVEWLRARNDAHRHVQTKARFYGLDLYSLRASMEAVVAYLDAVDPAAAAPVSATAASTMSAGKGRSTATPSPSTSPCPARTKSLPSSPSFAAGPRNCLSRDGWAAEDEYFFAEQNARLVRNAERYYREMYRGRVSSWNLRDTHMAETLDALVGVPSRPPARPGPHRRVGAQLPRRRRPSHRTGGAGELNVGQLARSHWPHESFLVGFTTHHGTVTAASDWGAHAERKHVRPALAGSYEELFHHVEHSQFLLPLGPRTPEGLHDARLERAIGVIYRPETERASHWFHARLPDQFDAVIHLDRTSAVEPLERTSVWDEGEPPETYPDRPLAPTPGRGGSGRRILLGAARAIRREGSTP